jgi:hypothetical protein
VRCGNSLKGDCAGAGVCLSQLFEYILSLLEPNPEVRSGALNFLFISSLPTVDIGQWNQPQGMPLRGLLCVIRYVQPPNWLLDGPAIGQ